MKLKKMCSLLSVGILMLSIGITAYAFEYPGWTSVNADGTKACFILDQDGTMTELPTFEEAYAYLDYDSAPDDARELILKARRMIVYGDKPWTVDGCVSILNADGTYEQLPEFKDLYPDWDLEELALKNDIHTEDFVLDGGANFSDNVDIPEVVSGKYGKKFCRFNSEHTYTITWASTLPGSRFNVGYKDDDADKDIGWIPNLKAGQNGVLKYDTGVRIAVRCSTFDEPGFGLLNVKGSNQLPEMLPGE